MSKNFEMLNKELDENNIKASLVIFPFAGGGVSAFRNYLLLNIQEEKIDFLKKL